MKILMVTPEISPFAKVGGLGDVLGSLPKALKKRGHDVRVVCPCYGCIRKEKDWTRHELPLVVDFKNGKKQYAAVWETTLNPIIQGRVYFIEYDHYFHRYEIYAGPWGDHMDNAERFAFLCRASLDLCYAMRWYPDVIHCNDWTTALVPVYLNTVDHESPLGAAATVMTVHNLQHQGVFSAESFYGTGLPQGVFRRDGLEALGCMNMLKGGLYHATKITTVSPMYAKEIQEPGHGCGLDDVLKFRAADLIGILNGIDTELWNAAGDLFLAGHYTPQDLSGKKICKQALQRRMGLEEEARVPIFGVVSRFYEQKGLDLFIEIIPELIAQMKIQIVVLGSGERQLEWSFLEMAHRYPRKVAVHIGYDEVLSHCIKAGSDFFVMPSRFEPCGLSQIYAMRYGTPPIVRATGGLLDTVEQYQEGKGEGTGFIFEEAHAKALYEAIGWACATYYDRPSDYKQLQINGMVKDYSWDNSAKHYEDVYRWAVDARDLRKIT